MLELLKIVALLCQFGNDDAKQIQCQRYYAKCLTDYQSGSLAQSAPQTVDRLTHCMKER